MSSLSPRVGLTVMADTDFVSSSSVDNSVTILDTATSITQCTSATRPSTPFEGQLIYETDTKMFRRWSATKVGWFLYGVGTGNGGGLGLINSFSDTSSHLLAGGGGSNPNYVFTSLLDYNFAVRPNWRYRIVEQGWFWATGTYNGSNTALIDVELYSLYNIGSNPALGSTGTALHYARHDYQMLQLGGRRSYFKKVFFDTPSSVSGNMYVRSCLRYNNAIFVAANQSIGRSADSIGSYAWVYSLGPSTAGY